MHRRRILAVMDHAQGQHEHVANLMFDGYGVATARTSAEAEKLVKSEAFGLVLADVSSPHLDSLSFLVHYRDKNPLGKIVVLSRRPDLHSAVQSLKLSAFDYLFEPVPRQILVATVERAFLDSEKVMARLRAHVAEENLQLKEELERANLDTIMSLAEALEARDEYTRGHSFRVSELAVRVGERMALSHEDLKKLRYGGVLHDIGKIGVDKKILNKRGPLTADDYENISLHTTIGVKIVSPAESLRGVVPLIQYHHEPYEHLQTYLNRDSRTFLLVCIIKVSDAYDAMVSDRPYRKALLPEMAITELRQYADTDFHPGVVEETSKVVRGDIIKKLRESGIGAVQSGMALGFI